MVALGTGLATFTFFTAYQLLQFAMQLLDLPAHGILVLNVVCGERAVRMIGNHPLKVAVWATTLNNCTRKGISFSFTEIPVSNMAAVHAKTCCHRFREDHVTHKTPVIFDQVSIWGIDQNPLPRKDVPAKVIRFIRNHKRNNPRHPIGCAVILTRFL